MHNPGMILVSMVVLVCGYTAMSFFKRAFEVNAVRVKSTPKVFINAVRFRYNLIMGVVMAFFAITGLVWVVQNW